MGPLSPCTTTTEAPASWSLCSATREATTMRSPCTTTKSSPYWPQLEKICAAIKIQHSQKLEKKKKNCLTSYRFLKTQFYLQSHCDLFSHCDLAEHFYLWSPTNYFLNQPPQCTFLRETAISLLACMLSCVQLSATLRTVVCQASLLTGFSRQEYWSGSLCPPPGDLPNPGIKLK